MTEPRPPIRRAAMLAKIHVARKQLAMEDSSYRAMLLRVAGVESAGDAPDVGLIRVLKEFERLGFVPRPAQRDGRGHVRKIYAIWADLKPLLDDADDQALRQFCRRQTRSLKNPAGIGAPEWLDPRDARRVIEGLKGWLARVQKERAHAETSV